MGSYRPPWICKMLSNYSLQPWKMRHVWIYWYWTHIGITSMIQQKIYHRMLSQYDYLYRTCSASTTR